MVFSDTADLWWKNAVIYCLDVETYADGNGDGIGDFIGLTERIDHIASLGVTCIWLMPFYPSPNRDDGYDVADHYAIDPALGTFGDFSEFMTAASDRGLRVIADLVVNHTSTEHRWFQEARRSTDSRYRDYYVWQDEIPEGGPRGVVFPGEQEGVWTYDTTAGQYYLHRFYRHQPDLNIAHAPVRDEIRKVMGFWLRQGLSGFRVDAVPFFVELDGIEDDMDVRPHDYLRDLRAFLNRRNGDAVMLGEVNLPPEEARAFFGDEDGDELHMLFNFIAMQACYLALARNDATPVVDALASLPDLPDENQWASFLRNHDELTLDKLTETERHEVFDAFGPDPDMQIFDRGLRRRLPPMLDGDTDRIRMMYSLMFALPGTPTLFYGEEIGMGENLDIEGRLAVRTPMQWEPGPSAGFTSAPAAALRRPVPSGEYSPDVVNVSEQNADPDSLLQWFRRLIRTRRSCPEVGFGTHERIDVGDPAVLVLLHEWEQRRLVTVHHFAARKQSVKIPVPPGHVAARDPMGSGSHIIDDDTLRIDLGHYDRRWLQLRTEVT